MIDKELFCECLESIRLQLDEDVSNAELVKQAFQVTEFALYDNTKLINSIMKLLRRDFPPYDSGFCELEHYAFVLNFGKHGEDYESPEELFDRLVLINKN